MADTETMSLLEFIRALVDDDVLRRLFQDDPEATLRSVGLEDLSAQDVDDALVLIDDSRTADFSRDYEGSSFDLNTSHLGSGDGGDDGDGNGDGGHREAVEHISRFITNNFVSDDDTIVDNSVNQQIDTGGGDFDQDIDVDSTVASGAGAVAAGDDIAGSTLTTGDGNQVGDGNVSGDGNVVGDGNQVVHGGDGDGGGNTVAFGSGDATSASFDDVAVDEGSALSVGGSAEAGYAVSDSFDTTDTTTTTRVDIEDSFTQDNDTTADTGDDSTLDLDVDSDDHTAQQVSGDAALDT